VKNSQSTSSVRVVINLLLCKQANAHLAEQYKKELNPDNPLGHGGAIAKTYASLLHSIYDDTNTTSFTPRVFKNVLGRYAPTFSGYGQQDSQEFMSFLVDGVHEDLNRILKKPYVENPESDDKTVNDPEAIRELGQKFREIHRARNDSVAMDLFNGFYKNTMVCPVCDKISITFDPYSLLALQLPIEHTWQHIIEFVPLHGRPIQVAVDIDKNATIRMLKAYVAKRIPGVNPKQLMMAEIYTHKFYKTFEDTVTIAEASIQARDELVMYELETVPTNFPSPKKPYRVRSMLSWNHSDDDDIPEADSPLAEKMLVPVFHRLTGSGGYSSGIKKGLTLWPSFVILTKEEAKDIYEIHRKVLGQVAQMTTKDIFEDKFANYASNNGSDAVLTTEEDASSNVDPNVKANSIEGDESIVDVTMTENGDAPAEQTPEAAAPASNAPVRHQHPALKPGEHLPIALNELFTMKVSKSNGKEMIQTGWSSIDANRDYPTIESRIPKSRRSSVQSNHSSTSTRSTGSEQSDHAQFSHNDSTFNAGSDSDTDLPPVSELAMQRDFRQKRNRNQSKRSKALKTYSLKGKGVRRDLSDVATENEEVVDAPLVKLGEAIICDWEPQQFESLFDGQDENDTFRGVDTWSVMEQLHDPELEAKQAKRAARKKTGITLEECFAETAKGEILSEDNEWYCNRCKERRLANKKLEIWTVPDILVIHLKRFSAHRGLRDKIDVLVDFPTENLDLKDWVGLPEGKNTVYDLFAVDNHYGGLGGGHYTAFAQNFYDQKWYEYNGKFDDRI
jgi:ubiquitin carboxyl-terminal hydrolase 4/11